MLTKPQCWLWWWCCGWWWWWWWWCCCCFDSGVHWDRSMMAVSPTRPDAPYQKWRRTTIYRYLQHVQKLLYIWNWRMGLQLKNHTIPIGPMLFLWRSRDRQPATSSLYMLVGSTRDVCNGRWEFTIKQLAITHFITNQQSLTGHWSTFNFGRWRLDVVPLFNIFILIKKIPRCGLNSPPKFIEMWIATVWCGRIRMSNSGSCLNSCF